MNPALSAIQELHRDRKGGVKIVIKIFVVSIIIIIFLGLFVVKTPLLKYPVSALISYALKSDASIEKCSLSFKKGIALESVKIKNKKGLDVFIRHAYIKPYIAASIKNGLIFDYHLKAVKFSYQKSEVINSIAKLLAIEAVNLLEFSAVDGTAAINSNEMTIKDLNAVGKDISLFINGTTKNNKYIDYIFKLTLSENFTSRIPEQIRQIFFRKEQGYSVVELYLNGDIKKPSINFSAPLFKLLIK